MSAYSPRRSVAIRRPWAFESGGTSATNSAARSAKCRSTGEGSASRSVFWTVESSTSHLSTTTVPGWPPRQDVPSSRSGPKRSRRQHPRSPPTPRTQMRALAELEAAIGTVPSAIVAFSGGVDSSLVAAAAARVLGDRSIAITAVSPALATGELDGARTVAGAVGIRHRAITTNELARDGYRRNAPDRCYHCKTELYGHLARLADNE